MAAPDTAPSRKTSAAAQVAEQLNARMGFVLTQVHWSAATEQQYRQYAIEQVIRTTPGSSRIAALMYALGGVAALANGALGDALFHFSFAAFCFAVPVRVMTSHPERLSRMWLAANLLSALMVLSLAFGWSRCHCMCDAIRKAGGSPVIVVVMQLLLFGPYQQVRSCLSIW